jgi:hypothetical protein
MYEGDHFLAFKEFGDLDLFLADHFRPLVTRKTDISISRRCSPTTAWTHNV